MKYLLLFVVFLQVSYSSFSQMGNFANNLSACQERKLYFQTDRESYITGDTIWAKAYFDNNESNCPLGALIVDLFDLKTSKKVLSNRFYISKNTALASIVLSDNLSSGKYMLMAYCYIGGNKPVASFSKCIDFYSVGSNVKEQLKYETELMFYPEGGNLIIGDTNIVAFKFADKMGTSLDISGKIYNSEGKLISSIKSSHNGRGTFKLFPKYSTQYYVILDEDRIKRKYPLPAATANGIITTLIPNTDGFEYSLKTTTSHNALPSFMILQTGKQVYSIILKTESGFTKGTISSKDLPSGVTRLAVFTKDTQLLAERMFFVNNKEYILPVDFQISAIGINSQSENLFSLNLHQPSFGTFAVSVTDADFESDTNKQNILSAFLLTPYLKENVSSPGLYFDGSYNNADELLDLIVRTNCWNLTKWEEKERHILSAPIVINNPGLISGSAFYKNTKKVYANKPLSLFSLSEADSSSQVALFNTDSNGRFITEQLNFVGKNRLTFTPTSSNKNDFISVVLDNYTIPDSLFDFPKIKEEQKQPLFSQMNRYDSITNSKEYLEKVTVKSKLPNQLKLLEKKYATGRFGEYQGGVYDLRDITDSKANIFDYLSQGYQGLRVTTTPTGGYMIMMQNSTGNFSSCNIYLDEVVVLDNEQLYSLRPNSVAMIKLMPVFDYGPNGGIPALAIYTRRGIDFTASDRNYDIKYYNGFSKVYQFPPVYSFIQPSKEKRITLLWNPKAATSRRVDFIPIHFYNNGSTRHYKIVVEGITEKGQLLYFKKTL